MQVRSHSVWFVGFWDLFEYMWNRESLNKRSWTSTDRLNLLVIKLDESAWRFCWHPLQLCPRIGRNPVYFRGLSQTQALLESSSKPLWTVSGDTKAFLIVPLLPTFLSRLPPLLSSLSLSSSGRCLWQTHSWAAQIHCLLSLSLSVSPWTWDRVWPFPFLGYKENTELGCLFSTSVHSFAPGNCPLWKFYLSKKKKKKLRKKRHDILTI